MNRYQVVVTLVAEKPIYAETWVRGAVGQGEKYLCKDDVVEWSVELLSEDEEEL